MAAAEEAMHIDEGGGDCRGGGGGGGMGRSADDDGIINDDEEYVCPIKEVDLTVPKTDDRDMPAVTFRMWVLGLISCVVLSFVNQFFWYRKNPLTVTSISAQVAVVPLGHLMSKTITKRVFFKGSPLEFTLNPGPFNVKEHVLITILANAGSGTVYATHILSAVKLFYKKELAFLPALILMITTQVLGFGWAGIFRKQLVEAAEMWWPANLIQVSLFRALHVKEKRPKGGLSRNQFFLIALICSFAYFVFPGFLFLMLTTFSWVCWIAPDSVLVNQLGSGAQGMGIGSLGFDWTTISAFLGSPLASPWFATLNILVGFILVLYVMVPICYWFNVYNAKNFPIYSDGLFHLDGSTYDTDAVIDSNFHLDTAAYQKSGPVYMSTFFTLTYGFGLLHYRPLSSMYYYSTGSTKIWNQTRNAYRANKKMDIHARLMKAYKQVPMWWFHVILIVNIAAIIFACEYYKMTLQLPWWGVLLACAIAFLYTLPIGIITATTNQQPGLNIITEYVIGYAYPGHPVANMCFKVYGYISMSQAVSFLADFKLGHYMKIPPRSMFMAQVLGTLVSGLAYTLTAWWLMDSIPNLCDKSVLPKDSPWTCPSDHVFYAASVIWGLVGPQRMFGNLGLYSKINYFFIGGAIAPVLVWLASKAFPGQGWIRMINVPVMLTATSLMPPASAVNYTSWLLLAFLSGYVVFRHWPNKWERYNYILSAGLDAGTAFMTVFMFFALQYKNINLVWWGSNPDGCPLASCPTAKGISVPGCPVFS